MKNIILIISFFVLLSCGTTNSQNSDNLISKLEKFEQEKDIKITCEVFCNEAIISHPDGLPVCGISAIKQMYDYLWENNALQTIKYTVDSIAKSKGNLIEYGKAFFKENNSKTVTFKYKSTFVKENDLYLIKEILYGNTELMLPKLPKPTGEYTVGKTNYFYNKNQTQNKRIISFEVWYPSNYKNEQTAQFQSIETTIHIAEFLHWPYFMNSFSPYIKTNSFKNAKVIQNQNFPVVIYNHGYGGFSSVYQTVFEELASHGYVVVSIGHQNESALLIVDNDSIIKNNPENKIYASREAELNGSEINALQNVILNSDNLKEIRAAYKKLIAESPLHAESTFFWANDTKETIRLLGKLNKNDKILKKSMNLKNIGVFGHSVGGATAGQLSYGNKNIKAGINLDGFQFGDLVNNQIEIPFMFVSSNSEDSRYLRYSNFIENSKIDCFHAIISGFTHGSFTDLEFFKPNGYRVIEPQRVLILSFFDKYLKNKDVDLRDIENSFRQIKLKSNK